MKISLAYTDEEYPKLEAIAIVADGATTPEMIRAIAGLLVTLGYHHDDIYGTMVEVGEEMLGTEEDEPLDWSPDKNEPPSDERDA